jgi:hypothetical protein
MPQQRKTRTRSSEPLPSRHAGKLGQVRREVAAEAARIIATEGQTNYHAAKKKAADRIGISERLALPSNLEVQDALLMYLGLYGGHAHGQDLQRLRAAALEAMHLLHAFAPRLVGPVLDGTAGRHSRVSLHVFCEGTESLVLHFLDAGVPFVQEQRRIRWHDGGYRSVPVLVVEIGGATVELLVFSSLDLRQAPPCPIDGRPQRRAGAAEVACLLNPRMTAEQGAGWTGACAFRIQRWSSGTYARSRAPL